jgi:arylsulfatase A-like enzyme
MTCPQPARKCPAAPSTSGSAKTTNGTKPSRVTKPPSVLLDIFPTFNALCGIPFDDRLDGESLIPLLEDPDQTTDRSVVITHGRQNHAVRSARWRYTRYADGSEELYDQKTDPKNFHNLAGQSAYATVKRDMINRLLTPDAPPDPASK